jgi:hypothetical protein
VSGKCMLLILTKFWGSWSVFNWRRGRRNFSSPGAAFRLSQTRHGGLTSSPICRYQGLFPGDKLTWVKLTTHFHLMPILSMCENMYICSLSNDTWVTQDYFAEQ